MARIAFTEPDWQQIPTIVDEVIWSYPNPRQCLEYREFVETLELWGVTGHRRWLDERGIFCERMLDAPGMLALIRNQERLIESIEKLFRDQPASPGGLVLLCGSLSPTSGGERFRLHRLDMAAYPEDAVVYVSRESDQRKTIFSGNPSQKAIALLHFGRNFEDEPQPSLMRLSLDTQVYGLDSLLVQKRSLAQSLDRVDGTPDLLATMVAADGRWTGIFLVSSDPLELVRRWSHSEVQHQSWGYYANCQRGEALLAVAKDHSWNLKLLEREWNVRPTSRQLVLHRLFQNQALRRPLVMDVPASTKAQRETRARTAHLSPVHLQAQPDRVLLRALIYQAEFPERLEEKTTVRLRSDVVAPLSLDGVRAPVSTVISDWFEKEKPEPAPPRFLLDLSAQLREDLRENPCLMYRDRGPRESSIRLKYGRSAEKEALKKHWCMIIGGFGPPPVPVESAFPLPIALLELERKLQSALMASSPEMDRENLVLNWFFPVQPNPFRDARAGVFQLRVPLAQAWHGLALGELFEGKPQIHLLLRDDGLYLTGLHGKGVAHRVGLEVPLELPSKLRLCLKKFRWSEGFTQESVMLEFGGIVPEICTHLVVSGNGQVTHVDGLANRSE